jgi:hypothetical protein
MADTGGKKTEFAAPNSVNHGLRLPGPDVETMFASGFRNSNRSALVSGDGSVRLSGRTCEGGRADSNVDLAAMGQNARPFLFERRRSVA